MIILYSSFAFLAILIGLITLVTLIRGGHTDSSDTSAIQHFPKDKPSD